MSDILTSLAVGFSEASLVSWSSTESNVLRSLLFALALGACASDPAETSARDPSSAVRGHSELEQELDQREGGVPVHIPARVALPASARPRPVLPQVANAHLRSEYAFIDIERAESMAWFSPTELERMTGSTFEDPRVRHVNGTRRIGDAHRSLDLLVVYSPESKDVFVLERTRELPADEYELRHEELRTSDEQALVDFLQDLGIPQVKFAEEAAGEIPASFGSR